tara:strand:+ start:414 stop:809 length:396 start_codon:yes stop_codon:yes gene_type:complete
MPEQQKTILLIEDDQFLRELVYKALTGDPELKEIKVEIATAGNQAIEKLKQLGAELNLILLDIILPEKNGYEILTFIQEDPKLKTVPVVVLSNLGQEEKIQKAKQLGAKDFMIKAQTDTDQIVVKVKQYLT